MTAKVHGATKHLSLSSAVRAGVMVTGIVHGVMQLLNLHLSSEGRAGVMVTLGVLLAAKGTKVFLGVQPWPLQDDLFPHPLLQR